MACSSLDLRVITKAGGEGPLVDTGQLWCVDNHFLRSEAALKNQGKDISVSDLPPSRNHSILLIRIFLFLAFCSFSESRFGQKWLGNGGVEPGAILFQNKTR